MPLICNNKISMKISETRSCKNFTKCYFFLLGSYTPTSLAAVVLYGCFPVHRLRLLSLS